MWLVATVLNSTALEERDGRVKSIVNPLSVVARGILRLR